MKEIVNEAIKLTLSACKSILDTVIIGIKFIFKMIAESLTAHQAERMLIVQRNAFDFNLQQFRCFQSMKEQDYYIFANALKCCLVEYHSELGLDRPTSIEAVLCSADPNSGITVNHVDGNYENLIFRYEISRRIPDQYLAGFKALDYKKNLWRIFKRSYSLSFQNLLSGVVVPLEPC